MKICDVTHGLAQSELARYPLPMMRAIVFDMDGLMIDSEKVYWQVGHQMQRARVWEGTFRPDLGEDVMGR